MTPLMALKNIVNTEGIKVIENPQKCIAMLKDWCNDVKYIQDINIISISLKNHIPHALLENKVYDFDLSKRLAVKLYENFGIREDVASNVINLWAQVIYSIEDEKKIAINRASSIVGLNILSHDDIRKISQNAQIGNVKSLNELGKIYIEGIYTNKNENKAFELFKRASEGGLVMADNNLGCCYEFGLGTSINHQLAFKHYYKAAQKNFLQAQFNTARCYEEGIGIGEDLNLAKDYFLKGALRNDVESQYRLANLNYKLSTDSNDSNMQQAFTWFLSAANSNHSLSQYNVAKCYELGLGIPIDLNAAIDWYKKALKNGQNQSEIDLKRLSFTKGKVDIFS